MLADLERKWDVVCGAAFAMANSAYVCSATGIGGARLVLKLSVPSVEGFTPAAQELAALIAAAGDPYVRLVAVDTQRRAVLLERLGPHLAQLRLPINTQLDVIAATVARGWRRSAEGLPTGRKKAAWLADYVAATWIELGRPCARETIDRAVVLSVDRAEHAHAAGPVLVHGDAHPHNVLATADRPGTYLLIDPEGLASEPEHDLGVTLRGWNEELLMAGNPINEAVSRCERVANLTGRDAAAIWAWSFVERVSTALFLLQLGHRVESRPYFEVADRLTGIDPYRG